MEKLDFLLVLFFVEVGVMYLLSLALAVTEYRRWNLPVWVVIAAALLFVLPVLSWLLVFYTERRKLLAAGADPKIAGLKIGLGWFLFLGTGIANVTTTYLCRYVADSSYASDLASCCVLIAGILFMLFGFWLNAKLNGMISL